MQKKERERERERDHKEEIQMTDKCEKRYSP